jgi:hypothetical protein
MRTGLSLCVHRLTAERAFTGMCRCSALSKQPRYPFHPSTSFYPKAYSVKRNGPCQDCSRPSAFPRGTGTLRRALQMSGLVGDSLCTSFLHPKAHTKRTSNEQGIYAGVVTGSVNWAVDCGAYGGGYADSAVYEIQVAMWSTLQPGDRLADMCSLSTPPLARFRATLLLPPGHVRKAVVRNVTQH